MKVSEVSEDSLIVSSLLKKYNVKPFMPNPNLDKTKISHSLDLHKLKKEIDLSMEKHGRHPWLSADDSSLRYTGFSINYNPNHQDQLNPNASSLGTPKNKRDQFYYNSLQEHEKIKNSYFDTYGFIKRTPAASEGYLSAILDTCQRTIIRSRMMILSGHYFDDQLIAQYKEAKPGDSKFGWHRDEPIHVNLRINIPITGNDAFVFEMLGEEPYFLEPGFAYSWDTNKPHRVWCREKTDLERYNLIVGVSPWFDYFPERDEWLPNQYCGKKDPMEMLREGLIFDWLRVK